MIERQTSHLLIAPQVCIRPGDSLSAVAALFLGESQAVEDMATGWQWLTVRNVCVDHRYFLLSFGFYHDQLRSLQLIFSPDRYALNSSWEDWSEQHELTQLKVLQQWLHAELGREGDFPWGTVTADYDAKGGSSSVTIQYH
jgi:cation diffusion facilitator CzcD-associated flavoprotein CzcO